MKWKINLLVLSFLGVLYLTENVQGIAVMSIDLGSEWMKIGIVSPGVPMEIVLNKESKRKTPIAISFRDGERLIGEDALNIGVRFPSACYSYFLDLLGKKMDNPIVKLFQERFSYYTLVEDELRGTVLFKHDSETYFSPEELLGMILSKARDFSQDSSRQPVKEAVITVPPFFNQAERRAVINAAELAGIKVLQLMNTNTAAALNYGIFRRKDFNETAQYMLIYDMGASSTVASVVSYQIAKMKERGVVETNPQLTIHGIGYDRTLGGLEMQIRLRDNLAKSFNDMKKTPTDIFTNARSMAKLFKEAGRVKNVLSANADHYAQVEGLLDEKDFRVQITREQFEKINEDLFDRVQGPIQQALDAAGITMDVIDQVLLVGAGTRVPKVQEKLTAFVKRDLGKSLNTDEAAAMGAVYKAADLSTGFKVKKFVTKDAVIFPVLVDFEREAEHEDGSKTLKIIRRTLFSHMNNYPQKKILTFNKHVDDFNFYVSYGELPISKIEASAVGSLNITKVQLSGVSTALQKHANEGESKGVKAHFTMDESGVLILSLVEAVFEKNATEEVETVGDKLSKLGTAFSNLFTGSQNDAPKADSETGDNYQEVDSDSTKGQEGEETKENTADGKETPKSDSESKPENNNNETPDADKNNATATNNTTTTTAADDNKKPKVVLVKEPLVSEVQVLDVNPLDGDNFKKSADKLKTLNDQDRVRALKEKARNALETFVIDMQNNLYSEEYEKAVTEEEKADILKICSEISDWLYAEGSDAEKTIYEEKLKSLRLKSKDLLDRVREHKDRPDALEALNNMLNISMGFLESSKSLPADDQLFTEVELTTLEKLVTETLSWRATMLKEQENIPLSIAPVLSVRSIAEKIDALDREVKYMVNKARVNKLNKAKDEAKKFEEQAKQAAEEILARHAENKTDADAEKSTETEEWPSTTNDSSSDNGTENVNPSKTEKDETHTEL